MTTAHTEKGEKMEWIVEAETIEDIVDGQMVICEEIVRCKDCRYGYQFYDVQNGITDNWVECRNANGLNRDVPEDGYCYYGERKIDDK